MDAPGRRGSRSPAPALGQHFLPPRLAADLVRGALVLRDDLVVEIGAGSGALTAALAARARSVVAIELDPRLARRLRATFADEPTVRVIEADARSWPLPSEPFRAFGNVPFAITSDLMRHLLDDPGGMLARADLIVQWEVARKRVADPPRNIRSMEWGPWWTFVVERRLPSASFRPPPKVDAALLTIRRRDPTLLAEAEGTAYRRLVRHLFLHPTRPVVRTLREKLGENAGPLMSDIGMSHRTCAIDMRIVDAVALFRRISRWSERD